VLSADEMAERIRNDIEEHLDPDEIAVEEAVYELLGMLDGTLDLGSALADLYAEQVGGRYLGEANELLVLGGSEPTPLTEWILFHELIHALTDQHFGFSETLDDLVEAERYHEGAAMQALVEGDATYFQIVYLQEMPADDQVAIAAEMLSMESPVADALPAWLTADLAFPYDAGFTFVERLVRDQGIAGLDQAYRLAPETIEQIMHPEKYFVFEPATLVDLPDGAPAGYEVALEGVFGEWNLKLFLAEGVGDGDAVIAAAGWGGDAFRMLDSGEEVAFAYRFAGDTPRDAEELEAALLETVGVLMSVGNGVVDEAAGSTTFTGEDFAFVQRFGTIVIFTAASDPAAGAALVENLRLESAAGE